MTTSPLISEIRLGLRAAWDGLMGRKAAVEAVPNAWNLAWRSFLAALIIMTQESHFTLPIMLTSVRSGYYGAIDWGALQAGVTVTILPCILLFLLLQRYYLQGMMGGAVKG